MWDKQDKPKCAKCETNTAWAWDKHGMNVRHTYTIRMWDKHCVNPLFWHLMCLDIWGAVICYPDIGCPAVCCPATWRSATCHCHLSLSPSVLSPDVLSPVTVTCCPVTWRSAICHRHLLSCHLSLSAVTVICCAVTWRSATWHCHLTFCRLSLSPDVLSPDVLPPVTVTCCAVRWWICGVTQSPDRQPPWWRPWQKRTWEMTSWEMIPPSRVRCTPTDVITVTRNAPHYSHPRCTVVGKSKWYHQVVQGSFHLKR